MFFMIRYTNSLFISIVIHSVIVLFVILIWQYYSNTKDIQEDKKVALKLSKVITPSELVTTPKQEQISKEIEPPKQEAVVEKIEPANVEPVQKVVEAQKVEPAKVEPVVQKIEPIKPEPTVKKAEPIKPIVKTFDKPKKIEKIAEKPKKIIKKPVKKYNLEPEKIYDFLVEEVPEELSIVNKRVVNRRVFQEPKEKKITKPKTVQTKKVVQKKIVTKPKAQEKKIVQKKAVEKTKVAQKKETELPPQKESSKNYLRVNTSEIAKLLEEHLYYPRSARKREIAGQVIMKFKLGLNSRVYDMEIIKSNSQVLSRAAMKTIMDLSGKFPKPAKELILHVPIDYKLK